MTSMRMAALCALLSGCGLPAATVIPLVTAGLGAASAALALDKDILDQIEARAVGACSLKPTN